MEIRPLGASMREMQSATPLGQDMRELANQSPEQPTQNPVMTAARRNEIAYMFMKMELAEEGAVPTEWSEADVTEEMNEYLSETSELAAALLGVSTLEALSFFMAIAVDVSPNNADVITKIFTRVQQKYVSEQQTQTQTQNQEHQYVPVEEGVVDEDDNEHDIDNG